MKVKILSELVFMTYPITEDMIDIDESILRQIGETLQFINTEGDTIPYTKPISLESKIKIPYDELVNNKIREKYTLSQELAILRQRDSKPTEYQEYYDYCEQCKAKAKQEVGV